MTGSGKSTFISQCTGERLVIGHGLMSCKAQYKSLSLASTESETSTEDIGLFTTTFEGQTVHLIDTTGLYDLYRTDAEILREYATWLLQTFQSHVKLSCIIFLSSINRAMADVSELHSLRTFKKMCGYDRLSNTALVTTFWDDVSPKVGDASERELRERPELWGDMYIAWKYDSSTQ
jgi:50S ribosome-binding GTPase